MSRPLFQHAEGETKRDSGRDGPPVGRAARSRWRLVVAFVSIVLVLGVGGFAYVAIRSEMLLRQGEAAFAHRQWSSALRSAEAELRLLPGSARGSSLAARCLTRLNRIDEAERHYRHAGSLGLEDLHARAMSLVRAQRPDEAAVVYEEILRRWPNDPTALRRLAAIRISRGKWSEALALAEPLIRDPKTEVVGLTLAATVHHNLAEFPSAIAAFQRVLELDPQLREMPLAPHSLFWEQLARDLIYEGRADEARGYLERGLAEGEDGVLLDLLGQTYQSENDLAQAERVWRRAIGVDPNHCDAWLSLGRLALQRKEPAEAARFLRRAAELSPQAVEPLYNLARAERLLGHDREADRIQTRLNELRRQKPPSPQPAGSSP